MKKILFAALAASMLFTFAACKKANDPASLFKQMIDVAAANDSDCAKSADEVKKFYDANKDVWVKGLKDLKAAGKSNDDIQKIMMGGDDAALKAKADGLKCGNDDNFKEVIGNIMMELAKSVI